jgi:hypothetical protein
MNRINKVSGEYFVYTDTRVLGPFKFYNQAYKALVEYEREQEEERRDNKHQSAS